jgi:hypothetical protein
MVVAADSRSRGCTGSGRSVWIDLASVIAGERLDRRAAVALAIALAAVATAAVVLLITQPGTHAYHPARH